jgi:hypothetical protein
MLFREKISVYGEKYIKHTNTLCGQNTEFQYVKAGGTHDNHWALAVNPVKKLYTP